MKKIGLLTVFIFMFVLFSGCLKSHSILTDTNNSLEEFIKGKWQVNREDWDINGKYQEKRFIKFMNSNTVKYCLHNPTNQFCENFPYTFTSDDKIFIENPRINGGYWKIMRNKENLTICFWGETDCVEFSRDTSKFNFLLEVLNIYR